MKEYVEGLEREFSAIERGFLHEQRCARSDYASFDPEQARRVAFLAYRSEAYQVRMYAVFLLGHLSQESDVLSFLRDDVSADSNWRVQEVLAKAYDDFCAVRGYEAALPVIDEDLDESALLPGPPGRCCLKVVEAAQRFKRVRPQVRGQRVAGHQQEAPGAGRGRAEDLEPGDHRGCAGLSPGLHTHFMRHS